MGSGRVVFQHGDCGRRGGAATALPFRLSTSSSRSHSGLKTAAVRIVGYGPNEIRLETDGTAPGILVLSEVYYPGWRAWVDDGEVQVLRADFLFRALPVAAGTHRVRLLYDPLSFKIGEAIFGVTVLAIGGWVAWEMRKSRQRDQNENRLS